MDRIGRGQAREVLAGGDARVASRCWIERGGRARDAQRSHVEAHARVREAHVASRTRRRREGHRRDPGVECLERRGGADSRSGVEGLERARVGRLACEVHERIGRCCAEHVRRESDGAMDVLVGDGRQALQQRACERLVAERLEGRPSHVEVLSHPRHQPRIVHVSAGRGELRERRPQTALPGSDERVVRVCDGPRRPVDRLVALLRLPEAERPRCLVAELPRLAVVEQHARKGKGHLVGREEREPHARLPPLLGRAIARQHREPDARQLRESRQLGLVVAGDGAHRARVLVLEAEVAPRNESPDGAENARRNARRRERREPGLVQRGSLGHGRRGRHRAQGRWPQAGCQRRGFQRSGWG